MAEPSLHNCIFPEAGPSLERFETALRSADFDAICESLEAIEDIYRGFKRAFRRVAKLNDLPADTRAMFLRVWVRVGDHIRSEICDDLVLIRGLHRLLPSYQGKEMLTLYRGESVYNWKRRTYGLSWSDQLDVARAFAEGLYRTFEGGSVLLKVVAPPQNIICAVTQQNDPYGEQEYLLDRRGLKGVTVVQRYQQITPQELFKKAAPMTTGK